MLTLQELAELVGGHVQGDASVSIVRLSPIDSAQPGDITFVANPKYLAKIKDCQASAIIIAPGVDAPGVNLLVCRNPYLAFAKILTHLQGGAKPAAGVRPGAHVSASAEIDPGATLYPGCFVGERVKVGAGTVIHSGVVLYDDVSVGCDCLLHAQSVVREGCRLGDRVILQPASVIGSDGFGFAPDGAAYYKIPQVGIVVLEDDVEIGACSCIDRAALGKTLIRRGTKLDNLVQIGHNAEIGEDCIIVSQVGVSGSTKIGRHCTLAGQVGVAGHIKIGDNVTIGAKSGVVGNVDSDQTLSGLPLMPHKQWLKSTMTLPKLPEMRKELVKLSKRIQELEALVKEK